MKTPHKHAELIKAWADGAEIEYYDTDAQWRTVSDPTWVKERSYRVKPEPKPDVVVVGIVEMEKDIKPELLHLAAYKTKFIVSEHWERDNIKLTFDGESGTLLRAEVL